MRLPLVLLAFGLLLSPSPSSAQDCDTPLCPPPTIYIYGRSGWYSAVDIIQFLGDSNYASLISGGCSAHDWAWGHCNIDTGFTFRRVRSLNTGNCTFAPSDTCEIAKVACCQLWPFQGVCPNCGSCCNDCDLCASFWEVVTYHADGATGRGCWELNYVADCTTDDCEGGLVMCNTVRYWDH